MNINCEEYSQKLSQFMDGTLTKEEWIDYCKEILEEIMDANKDVFIRMKERGEHGSLFDRGSADSYYGRKQSPHWYPKGTGMGEPVVDLTPEEVAEYVAGYEENEKRGSKKHQD